MGKRTRSTSICVTLTDAEKKIIQDAADRHGMTDAGYIRLTMLDLIKKEILDDGDRI